MSIYESRHWVGELLCVDCRLAPSDDTLPPGVGSAVDNVKSDSGSYSKEKNVSRDISKELSVSIEERDRSRIMNSQVDISELVASRSRSATKSIAEQTPRQDGRRSILMSFSNFDEATATAIASSDTGLLSKLGLSSQYVFPVHPVPTSNASPYQRKYNNLVDLCLPGRALGDDGIVELFQALSFGDLIPRIRVLELQNNKIGDRYLEFGDFYYILLNFNT